jgi:gluconate 2-dehydrogenase gamma chain
MNRRTSLAALGTLASSALFPRVLEAWSQTPTPALADWRPRALTPEQGAMVAALADAILPETDTPSATAAGVHVFVDLAVAECLTADARQAFIAGLAELDRLARADHGGAILALAPDARTAMLVRLEPDHAFVKTFKALVVLGYGTSKVGATQALAYDHVPGRYRGCVPLAPGQRTWATR